MMERLLFPITLLLSPVLVGSVATARSAAFIPDPSFIPNLAKPRQPKTHTGGALFSTEASADIKIPSTTSSPLIDLPMQRLKLPRFAVGREYVVVPLKIHGEGPFEFVLDTGLTIELITPHLVHTLKHASGAGIVDTKKPAVVEGLAAGGTTAKEKLVELSGLSVCDGEKELHLPTLRAAITDFSQEHMDPRHPVEGMIGMEMLKLFDVDLDFPAGRIRFWAPGTAAEEAKRAGLVEIPTAVINESLVLGTRVTGKPSTKSTGKSEPAPPQPFLGILDSGSTFSAVNWEAAKLLDLPPKSNRLKYMGLTGIMAVGIDGKPLYIPTKKIEFTFCGDPIENEQGEIVEFAPPPSKWQPWKPVMAGVGDLPIFELLLRTGEGPFHLPAAVIGLDVLSQRRVILEACSDDAIGRSRRMFVSPK